jgi:hypothetical protein
MSSGEHDDTSSKSSSWNNQFPWMQVYVRCLEILNNWSKSKLMGKLEKVEQ